MKKPTIAAISVLLLAALAAFLIIYSQPGFTGTPKEASILFNERKTEMKTRNTVQKTCNVLQVLAKIAEILCIVGASICALTALCAITWNSGGHVFSIFGTPIEPFIQGDLRTACGKLPALTLTITADAILFGLAHSYLKQEQANGTPFTKKGAQRLKMLGIRCIYIPIIALSASAAIAALQGVKDLDISGNLPSLTIGVGLILFSLVCRYGAELEEQLQAEQQPPQCTGL